MFDMIAIGELLADFIGTELNQNLEFSQKYVRYQGGSPSNLAANMARLGAKTAIVSCVGNENLGSYLIKKVADTGVHTQFIQKINHLPSSIVLVSRTEGTPDFIAYRQADAYILPKHIPTEVIKQTQILHTTCFALSIEPAKSTIVNAFKEAHKLGVATSIDLNYAPEIWSDTGDAHLIINEICGNGAFVKVSQDDFYRLFNVKDAAPERVIDYFLKKGANIVCYTKGKLGSWVASQNQPEPIHAQAQELSIMGDATGAGDAYWAAFLTAHLKKYELVHCAAIGSKMAKLKLETVGLLPDKIDFETLI